MICRLTVFNLKLIFPVSFKFIAVHFSLIFNADEIVSLPPKQGTCCKPDISRVHYRFYFPHISSGKNILHLNRYFRFEVYVSRHCSMNVFPWVRFSNQNLQIFHLTFS